MPVINGLHVIDHPAHAPEPSSTGLGSTRPESTELEAPAPDVVLVHGSLDRAQSFRRVVRRLGDLHVVAYDRRGYAGSPLDGPPLDLHGHVDDLIGLLEALAGGGEPEPATLVGHSYGGDVVLGAALRRPDLVHAVAAYEPPMPWLGLRRPEEGNGRGQRWHDMADDPGDEAERFFRRMVGDHTWGRLSETGRAARRADGPALVADLASFRGSAPFDVTGMAVPAVFGRGGAASAPHHRRSTAWLADNVPGAVLFEVEGSTHGAHLSHPDGFADLIRATVAAGARAGLAPGRTMVARP